MTVLKAAPDNYTSRGEGRGNLYVVWILRVRDQTGLSISVGEREQQAEIHLMSLCFSSPEL